MTKSSFTNFLDPPLLIENDLQKDCLSFKNYNNTQFFTESNLCIDSCTFSDCRNEGWYCKGGAIHFVNKDSSLKIHGTIFENCLCQGDGGAIFAASEKGDTNSAGSGSTSHKNMISFYSHYCCYSGCSAEIVEPNNIPFSGYGSALFVASTKIELNYSSSIECPKGNSSYGAQFDMQTEDVKSCFINATSGNSVCCAAIEYRNAKTGFFSYQTIVNQIGGFLTSFTTLIGPVNISSCNLVNNTIRYTDYVPNCSIVHVRVKSVVISRFVVIDTNFDGFDSSHHPFFASKGNDITDEFTITVTDCLFDEKLDDVGFFVGVTTSLNSFVTEGDEIKTHTIQLLSLGDCQGVVQPPPMVLTPMFSLSEKFTFSKEFSKSDAFSESNRFTTSHAFSETDGFTTSHAFSESNRFTTSHAFSESNRFTTSHLISEPDGFSRSNFLSESNRFTTSHLFSDSGGFTTSHVFSESDGFTTSHVFSESNHFTSSSKFTATIEFSESNHFESQPFSSQFTLSFGFSGTMEFTKSDAFVLIGIKDSNNSDKSKMPLIGGIIGSAAGVAAISGAVVFLVRWRRTSQIDFDIQEASNASSSEVVIQNPLYRQNMEDDPFQNDFNEHLASLDTTL